MTTDQKKKIILRGILFLKWCLPGGGLSNIYVFLLKTERQSTFALKGWTWRGKQWADTTVSTWHQMETNCLLTLGWFSFQKTTWESRWIWALVCCRTGGWWETWAGAWNPSDNNFSETLGSKCCCLCAACESLQDQILPLEVGHYFSCWCHRLRLHAHFLSF